MVSDPVRTDTVPGAPDGTALAGLRVVDCTHVIAGAYCTAILADLGADVVKVEPLTGEFDRASSTHPFQPFDHMNRNKRGIAVDLRRPEAVALVTRLAESADVFVENFRPGTFERLGLGYEDLKALNPGLIYCSVSGFGHTGPYRDRPGFDLIAQAMSGIMSLTGPVGGTEPIAAGVPICDFSAGIFGALGILAALQHRHSTGRGQKVEATLLESGLGHAVWEAALYTSIGHVSGPSGSGYRLAAPYEAFRTADSHIVVGVNSQGLWARFCRAVADPDLETDDEFATPTQRIANRAALKERIEAILANDTTERWQEVLLAEGVPAGPVNTIADAIADPHLADRGMFVDLDGQTFTRAPVTLTETPARIDRAAPKVGEHTRDVLRSLGCSDEEIDSLDAAGIIRTTATQEDEQ